MRLFLLAAGVLGLLLTSARPCPAQEPPRTEAEARRDAAVLAGAAREGELLVIGAALARGTPVDAPDSDGGTCSTPFNLDPTRICTRCGNGQCGAGENRCNCPADCM